ncbi:hypothetical protein FQY83_04435 [Luteimonas marina]|uniref:Lipoprotein n=1 Tax=Luteimonas marina TaxID=488485 RepID=A0A5C5U7Y3_9GAMM|nr:hypothetical protein [Luteimonas marina]TWT22284.1 hypothetical protein FQY83_04435 [Luteimonas marina]
MPAAAAGLAAATLALLAGGCGGPAADGTGNAAPSAAADAPTLYLDQVVQMLEEGRNAQLEGYRDRVQRCREAGFPVQPIPASDEHLIATQRWRMWRDRDRYAYRMEVWHVAQPEAPSTPAELCTFTLGLTGLHGYVDAQRAITLDLETGERMESDGNPDIVMAVRDPPGGSGPAGTAAATVAGQPCNRWQAPSGATVCMWSGGTRWGFASSADDEFNPGTGMHLDHIVLEASPPPDAIGYELRTTTFVVGAPLDEGALQPPQP